jgi:hypothetical protein
MYSINNPSGAGSIELDMMEMYGTNATYLQQYVHAYSPAFTPTGTGSPYAARPDGDLTWEFHTVGMKVTGSGTAAGTVCSYLDEKLMACSPLPQYAAPASTPNQYGLLCLN